MRYLYDYEQDGYVVISDGRIGAFGNHQVIPLLRKIVTRDIGRLYYNLPLNDDPKSVLYRNLAGPEDLRQIGEDF